MMHPHLRVGRAMHDNLLGQRRTFSLLRIRWVVQEMWVEELPLIPWLLQAEVRIKTVGSMRRLLPTHWIELRFS